MLNNGIKEKTGSKTQDKEIELVIFIVNNNIYGIDTRYIVEIINGYKITEVPMDYVEGMITHRGRVIVLVNLAKYLFGIEPKKHRKNLAIVCIEDNKEIALEIDGTRHIKYIKESDIIKPAGLDPDIFNKIQGYIKSEENELIGILNIENIINNIG